jgi:hypothetical protein
MDHASLSFVFFFLSFLFLALIHKRRRQGVHGPYPPEPLPERRRRLLLGAASSSAPPSPPPQRRRRLLLSLYLSAASSSAPPDRSGGAQASTATGSTKTPPHVLAPGKMTPHVPASRVNGAAGPEPHLTAPPDRSGGARAARRARLPLLALSSSTASSARSGLLPRGISVQRDTPRRVGCFQPVRAAADAAQRRRR